MKRALLLLLVGLPLFLQESAVPRMVDATAQLDHARGLKRRLAEMQGDELVAWRARVVDAYRAVRTFHPERPGPCAEAAFRAGEILRAAGDERGAQEEFEWCARHSVDEFGARARLEIAHLHRRARRWRAALELYLEVAADATVEPSRREDAWSWAGTAWKALGRPEDARLAWSRVAEHGTDPLARIRAFDELAMLLLEADDLEGAAGMLERCQRALETRALEETETGERVRGAMLRMRVIEELQRAIARRSESRASSGTRRKS